MRGDLGEELLDGVVDEVDCASAFIVPIENDQVSVDGVSQV
jgi:hypothetical protein